MARRPQPADLRFRTAQGWQWAQRLSLAASWALLVLGASWQLRAQHAAGGGLFGEGLLPTLLGALGVPPDAPPLLGPPGAVRLFGLELQDPLATLGVIVATQSLPGLAALPAVALMVVLGRFFCGWVCPYVPLLAVSNALRAMLARARVPTLDLELPRRWSFVVLLVGLALTAAFGTQVLLLVHPPSLFGREAFRLVAFGGLGLPAATLGAILLFDTLVSRAGFCRSLCPGGALFSALSAVSPLRIRRVAQKCTDCTACDAVCNLGQGPMTDRLDAGCERCGKCVAVCPTDALSLGLVQLRRRGDA